MALYGSPTRCAALGLDPAFVRRVRAAAGDGGLVVTEARSADAPDVLRADVVLAGSDVPGIADLARPGARSLVVCVGHGDDLAVARAFEAGADDVVTARVRGDEVAARLRAVAERLDRDRACHALLSNLAADALTPIGRSPAFHRLESAVEHVGPTAAHVRLEGEPGSGKTFAARRLHRLSPRRDAPLLVIEGADVRAGGALFGDDGRAGALRNGRGCTILVRRVERLDPPTQSDLARWIATGRIPRGPHAGAGSDARLLATAPEPIESMAARGAVVPDLAAALAAVAVRVPPLRDRGDDAVHLLAHFLQSATAATPQIDGTATALLATHRWPGNVAEVRALAAILAARSPGRTLGEAEILPLLAFPWPRESALLPPGDAAAGVPTLREVSFGHMVRVLALAGGNRTRAAKALGISARTLYNHLHAAPDGRPAVLPEAGPGRGGAAEDVAPRTR